LQEVTIRYYIIQDYTYTAFFCHPFDAFFVYEVFAFLDEIFQFFFPEIRNEILFGQIQTFIGIVVFSSCGRIHHDVMEVVFEKVFVREHIHQQTRFPTAGSPAKTD
jgi:hypothetical protein